MFAVGHGLGMWLTCSVAGKCKHPMVQLVCYHHSRCGRGCDLPHKVVIFCYKAFVCVCVCVCVWRGGGESGYYKVSKPISFDHTPATVLHALYLLFSSMCLSARCSTSLVEYCYARLLKPCLMSWHSSRNVSVHTAS